MKFVYVVIATLLSGPCFESAAMDAQKQQVHDFTQQWSTGGPSQWLQKLRASADTVFYVSHAPEHCIAETDLAALMSEMDSDAAAGVVCHLASAHAVHDEDSTVGREAAILVEAFRRSAPYPGNCSDLHVVDVVELRQWWTRRSR